MKRVLNKSIKVFVVFFFFCIFSSALLFSKVQGASLSPFDSPFLLTSGGQGPGSKMLRLLLLNSGEYKLEEDFFLEDEPLSRLEEIDSGKYNTLVVVIGVTDKGLGASGITILEEVENLRSLISLAKAKDISIISIYLEDAKNEIQELYTNNDMVIDIVCPSSDWIICKKDSKNRFSSIARKYNIPLTTIDTVQELVKNWYKIFPVV